MASSWTNQGAKHVLGMFRAETPPTNYYMRLITSAVAPTVDDDTVAGYTEVTGGTGYDAGGLSIARNSTDWDVWTLDDTSDFGHIQLKDLAWTASGGSISNARYAVLTDDNATDASRIPFAWFDLTSDRTVTSGQVLTLQDCELKLTTV